MTDSVQSWSIIIFAYNEESGIQSVIEKALIVLKQISTVNGELIIVNDGSTDNTAKIIEQFAENNPEIIIVNHQNHMNHSLDKKLIIKVSKINHDPISDMFDNGSLDLCIPGSKT